MSVRASNARSGDDHVEVCHFPALLQHVYMAHDRGWLRRIFHEQISFAASDWRGVPNTCLPKPEAYRPDMARPSAPRGLPYKRLLPLAGESDYFAILAGNLLLKRLCVVGKILWYDCDKFQR